MDDDERIEQFRKMAKANPEDELAHFALGSILLENERCAEATMPLRAVLRLNPDYSQAYLLLGRAQDAIGDSDSAIATWQRGYGVAKRNGHLMAAGEMRDALLEKGAEIPEPEPEPDSLKPVDDGRLPGPGEVRCVRSGRIGAKMKFTPFTDRIGAYIAENVSHESWQEWMEMSVKVINELRLDLGDPRARRIYDEHMREFLRLPDELFNP